jgi:hypothetical protein
LNTPGIDPISRRTPSPGHRNIGATNAPGRRCVSRTNDRIASVLRNRRILVAGKFIPTVYVGPQFFIPEVDPK